MSVCVYVCTNAYLCTHLKLLQVGLHLVNRFVREARLYVHPSAKKHGCRMIVASWLAKVLGALQ